MPKAHGLQIKPIDVEKLIIENEKLKQEKHRWFIEAREALAKVASINACNDDQEKEIIQLQQQLAEKGKNYNELQQTCTDLLTENKNQLQQIDILCSEKADLIEQIKVERKKLLTLEKLYSDAMHNYRQSIVLNNTLQDSIVGLQEEAKSNRVSYEAAKSKYESQYEHCLQLNSKLQKRNDELRQKASTSKKRCLSVMSENMALQKEIIATNLMLMSYKQPKPVAYDNKMQADNDYNEELACKKQKRIGN